MTQLTVDERKDYVLQLKNNVAITGTVVAMMIAVILGQMHMYGDYVRPIAAYFGADETAVAEIGIQSFAVFNGTGALLYASRLIWSYCMSGDKTTKVSPNVIHTVTAQKVQWFIAAVGFFAWEAGYMAIAWEPTDMNSFLGVTLGLISFGGGLFTWAVSPLIFEMILNMQQTNAGEVKVLFALQICLAHLYTLFTFPYWHSTLNDPVELDRFYLNHRTIACGGAITCFGMILCLIVRCCGEWTPIRTAAPAVANGTPPVLGEIDITVTSLTPADSTTKLWVSFALHNVSAFLFCFSYYSFYVFLVPYMDTVQYEDREFETRLSVMMYSTGAIVGISLVVFAADFAHMVPASPTLVAVAKKAGEATESAKNAVASGKRMVIKLTVGGGSADGGGYMPASQGADVEASVGGAADAKGGRHPRDTIFGKVLNSLMFIVALVSITLWQELTKMPDPDDRPKMAAAAFFIGFSLCSIYFDFFVSTLYYYNGIGSLDFRVFCLLLSFTIPLCIVRYDTGILGKYTLDGDRRVIDYTVVGIVLSSTIGGSFLANILARVCCSVQLNGGVLPGGTAQEGGEFKKL